MKLNTGICPLFNPNMYEGQFGIDFILTLDEEDNIEIEIDEYKSKVVDIVQDWFDKNELIGIKNVKITEYDSPDYYNYRGDLMNFEADVDINVILTEFLKVDKESTSRWLEQFKSRSGFVSFTESVYDKFIEKIKEGNEQEVGQAIAYINNDLQEEFVEKLQTEMVY